MSAEIDETADPPKLRWTCPICKGDQQADAIEREVVVRAIRVDEAEPWMDVICHCGHTHGEHDGGCGFGFQVKIPASIAEGSA